MFRNVPGWRFGLSGSHHLIPDFDPDALKDGRFEQLYTRYAEASEEERNIIDRVADMAVQTSGENRSSDGEGLVFREKMPETEFRKTG